MLVYAFLSDLRFVFQTRRYLLHPNQLSQHAPKAEERCRIYSQLFSRLQIQYYVQVGFFAFYVLSCLLIYIYGEHWIMYDKENTKINGFAFSFLDPWRWTVIALSSAERALRICLRRNSKRLNIILVIHSIPPFSFTSTTFKVSLVFLMLFIFCRDRYYNRFCRLERNRPRLNSKPLDTIPIHCQAGTKPGLGSTSKSRSSRVPCHFL